VPALMADAMCLLENHKQQVPVICSKSSDANWDFFFRSFQKVVPK
jgi:hypothetical protein